MKQWVIPAIFLFSVFVSIVVVGLVGELAGVWTALILPISVWYLMERRRATKSLFGAVILIAFIAVAFTIPVLSVGMLGGNTGIGGHTGLKKFSSYDELKNFMKTNLENLYGGYGYPPTDVFRIGTAAVPSANNAESDFSFTMGGSTDFSTTNIQVEGVDEADIVKCDGRYIYVVSGDNVFITDAYPPSDARVLSEIQENENPSEIYINENKLVVLGWDFAKVYDVSDRENPTLRREVSFDGEYFNSRMINDYVYLIITSPQVYALENEINLPEISCNGDVKTVPATDIYYFENLYDYSYQFTTIMAINTQNDGEAITSETFLMTTAQNLFVSSNNIYITYTNYWVYPRVLSTTVMSNGMAPSSGMAQDTEKTIIHKIAIADGGIGYKCRGEVPGHVLNQFSMDEYQGYFRIATTMGWHEANNVYVLNEDLNITGRLENIAPGEGIYSARFMGSRAYLVTFVKVDPLFVIDLSDPNNPRVLGELEIPGYSDYLHPYDETHIIGVGKNAVDSEEGNFAWYQGVKVALFDVSDPENPREISSYVIGDRGTNSDALYDHKAFLFSRSKNLLVIPIQLAEIDEGEYPEGVPSNAYGEYVWQGAYVFDISLSGGLVLKGGITHCENDPWSGWYSVKRSLYIENVLYTISNGLVKMNDLSDLSEINSIRLSAPVEQPWVYYPMVR
jgi:inhibitor of cysteine peptidase